MQFSNKVKKLSGTFKLHLLEDTIDTNCYSLLHFMMIIADVY